MKALPSERGQAMVLIVFAIIGLFGMAALAIDMGQIYSARRNAQNAADAAALAAAYDASAGSQINATAKQIAFDMTKTNGFNNDQVTNWVLVNNPPVDGAYCGSCGGISNPEEYYQVKITVRAKPIFAQLVFKGVEQVSVEAVAHSSTATDISSGNALMSLSNADGSMVLNGNTKVNIKGGNIRSDGDLTKDGCAGAITVESGSIYYGKNAADGFKGCDSPFNIAPDYSPAVNVSGFIEPACPKKADTASWLSGDGYKYKKDDTYGATTYYYESGLPSAKGGKSVVTLPAGIHCIDGGIGKGEYEGTDVLIVLLSGDIQQTGGDSFNFSAATDIKDANGTQFGGLVFYAPPSNKSTFKFGGNSDLYLYGTFFAPGADCNVGGSEKGQALHSAIICNTITDHGEPTVKIDFAPEQLFHFPPRVELVQ